jgi:DNA-binding XRE family transcriptional regulator
MNEPPVDDTEVRLAQIAQTLLNDKATRSTRQRNDDWDLDFASRIRSAIRESPYYDYNQTELARVCDTKQTTFSLWYTGLRKPEIDTGINFCKVFNCSFEWLYTGRGFFRPANEKEMDQLTLRLLKVKPSIKRIMLSILEIIEKEIQDE